VLIIAAKSRSRRPAGSLIVACAIIAAALSTLVASAAHAQIIRDFWVPNGPVNAVALSGSTLYIGGAFTSVGPPSGNGVPLSASTGTAAGPYPKVAGTVRVAVSDGAGGWYVAGAIGRVGGVVRGLAHILADGSLSSWDPNPDGLVNCLAVSGSTVYVGGYILNVGGQPRTGLGAVDAATGAATSWNPNAGGIVYAVAVSGSTVYAGGGFTTMGGQTRRNIAAIDAATGAVTAWNPNANNAVRAIAVSGSTVYAGGVFTTIGGQSRRIAALDAATGAATAWNPGANSAVFALVVNGSTVYAGGDFTTSGGQTRNHIVALDAATGLATAWDPNANARVSAIAVDGSTVYAGGDFSSVGGQTRNHIAALDGSGSATAWNPNANGAVLAIASNGSTVYAGGEFTSMGSWLVRNALAALDVTTGVATAWDPGATGGANPVHALAVDGSTVYAGGEFTVAGGQARNRIAALDAATGAATSWNPNSNGTVYALAPRGSSTTVYAGGEFSSIGGQARNSLAELDPTTGQATSWDPSVLRLGTPGLVYTVRPAGPKVYAGGNFTTVGGQARANLAAVDNLTGAPAAWSPNPDGDVKAIVTRSIPPLGSSYIVYAGGDFHNIGGQPRNYLASMGDPGGAGSASPWNPDPDLTVNSLAQSGHIVYAGGFFSTIVGQNRPGVAAFYMDTGALNDWNPDALVSPFAIAADASNVYTGGGEEGNFLFALSQATVSVPERPVAGMLDLAQNRPNPAASSTLIEFTLPIAAPVRLAVFDLQGRRVASLLEGEMRPAGVNRVPFRPAGLASGMYLYQVEALGRSATRKMIVTE
jgi:hypothetical protein